MERWEDGKMRRKKDGKRKKQNTQLIAWMIEKLKLLLIKNSYESTLLIVFQNNSGYYKIKKENFIRIRQSRLDSYLDLV